MPSFQINRATPARVAAVSFDLSASAPASEVACRWEQCPHCHQPLPRGWNNRMVYVEGVPFRLKDAPRSYTRKDGTVLGLDQLRGTYVVIG